MTASDSCGISNPRPPSSVIAKSDSICCYQLFSILAVAQLGESACVKDAPCALTLCMRTMSFISHIITRSWKPFIAPPQQRSDRRKPANHSSLTSSNTNSKTKVTMRQFFFAPKPLLSTAPQGLYRRTPLVRRRLCLHHAPVPHMSRPRSMFQPPPFQNFGLPGFWARFAISKW